MYFEFALAWRFGVLTVDGVFRWLDALVFSRSMELHITRAAPYIGIHYTFSISGPIMHNEFLSYHVPTSSFLTIFFQILFVNIDSSSIKSLEVSSLVSVLELNVLAFIVSWAIGAGEFMFAERPA